jgi:hypothetical protein
MKFAFLEENISANSPQGTHPPMRKPCPLFPTSTIPSLSIGHGVDGVLLMLVVR